MTAKITVMHDERVTPEKLITAIKPTGLEAQPAYPICQVSPMQREILRLKALLLQLDNRPDLGQTRASRPTRAVAVASGTAPRAPSTPHRPRDNHRREKLDHRSALRRVRCAKGDIRLIGCGRTFRYQVEKHRFTCEQRNVRFLLTDIET